MSIWYSFIDILPFIALISFELVSVKQPILFGNVFDHTFDGGSIVFIDQSWGEILDEILTKEKFVDHIDENSVKEEIEEELVNTTKVNGDSIKKHTQDYVRYSDDWLRTRISIFITFIAVIAIFYTKMDEVGSELDFTLGVTAMTLLITLLFGVYAFYSFESEQDPYSYSSTTFWNMTKMSVLIIGLNLIVGIIIFLYDIFVYYNISLNYVGGI